MGALLSPPPRQAEVKLAIVIAFPVWLAPIKVPEAQLQVVHWALLATP